jgi:hypothetical protein
MSSASRSKSVNLSSETYGFERRPVTSLGHARPVVVLRNGMRREEAVAADLIPQRLLQCSPNSAPIQRPRETPSPRLDYRRSYCPGAAVAEAATKCHLWLGLACDRLNGL